jgi:acyl-lipid omega-6 desaturase (Delta-12 desaturase)
MRQGKELILATKPFAEERRGRSWWALVSTVAVLLILLGLTTLDIHWGLRLPCSVLASLVLVRLFVIYHDYLHGAILERAWLADVIFTIYGLMMLTPRSIWKHSHDHHHHHNGQYFGTGEGTFPLMTTEEYAQASRWQRLRYKVLRNPMMILLGFVTVFLYKMCLYEFLTSPRQHFDAGLALLLQAGLIVGLILFAPGAIIFTFLIPTLVAGALGTYLFYAQHNFPAARYRDEAGWEYVGAALYSSSYMRLHPVLHWFTGNIGFHHVHHLNSRIPFYRLPEAMAGIEELQSPGVTSLHPLEIYRCLRLKLWDPERGRLVTFREFKQHLVDASLSQHRYSSLDGLPNRVQSQSARENAAKDRT